LRRAKQAGFVTKSGLMLGIGEQDEEIAATLREMAADHLDILTLGQYLRPSAQHLPMHRWVPPEDFLRWKNFGLEIGFRVVEPGPLVRSSYHADEQSDALVPGTRPVLVA
jgi:lipoic acid synthetase